MNYEENCLALDKQLAELLGLTNIEVKNIYIIYDNKYGFMDMQARWTQDDAEAFQLAAEHEMDMEWYYSGCSATDSNATDAIYQTHLFKDFPDKVSAMRYAIVQAVINKLKDSHG